MFSKLIKQIYGLCLDNESLPRFLAELEAHIQCPSIGIQLINKSDFRVVSGVTKDASEQKMHLYAEHFMRLKPYLSRLAEIEAQTRSGEVYVFRDPDMSRLEHASHLFDADAYDSDMVSLIFREGAFFIQLVIQCDSDMQPDYRSLLSSASLLFPHVHQAFRIFHVLEQSRNYAASFEQTMDHLSSGVVLFDGRGKACYQNRQAREMIADNRALGIFSGKLFGATPEASRQLRQLLASAIENGKQDIRKVGVMTVANGRTGQSELVVIAIPLQPEIKLMLEQDTGVYAAIMIASRDRASSLDPEVLQLLYGLTHAEAMLAVLLSSGKSLEQCSAASSLSLNTVRSYLKLIFQKTMTCRQAELVSLLRTIPTTRCPG